MVKENNLYQKAYSFAIEIVKLYKWICTEKNECILSRQLMRSGTSIGANIAEANGAISKADFSAKISISYKESLESKYWLSLMKDTDLLDKESFQSLYKNADELSRIMFTILKKTRIKQ
jgi:four helix bundle protein